MTVINNFIEYKALEGKMIGTSAWHTIHQAQIDRFAEATLDYQWIHTDKEKAEKEGPFKSTIAHGYLTLALIPYLWKQIADVRNVKMEINYGIENLKFGQPVLVGEEVQLQAKVKSIANLRGTVKATIQATLVVRDNSRPVYIGDVVFLYHFN